MKRFVALMAGMIILATSGGCYTVTGGPLTPAQKADELARKVALASGGQLWPRVSSVSFTLVVREGGNVKLSRSHLWNLRNGTDIITVGGKATTIDVAHPASDDSADADLQKAFTEDTQWLMTPLRLFAPGVKREYLGRRELLGKNYEVLHLSFDESKNMTPNPGDAYDLYVDPLTNLITFSDYIPSTVSPAQDLERATWEDYVHSGGFVLSTLHRLANKTVVLENLSMAVE